MNNGIYHSLTEGKRQGKKSFAVLIDPDKVNDTSIEQLITLAVGAKVDYFLVGGSLVISNYLDECVKFIKRNFETLHPFMLLRDSNANKTILPGTN